jgi:hypothetical protein
VAQFVARLFQRIDVVPAGGFYPAIENAVEAIGEAHPDDAFYSACPLASGGAILSDDPGFDERDLAETYSTSDVMDSFDTR